MNCADRLADEYAARCTNSKYKGHKELAVRLEGENVYGDTEHPYYTHQLEAPQQPGGLQRVASEVFRVLQVPITGKTHA